MCRTIGKIDTEAATTACLDRAPDSVPARKPRQPRSCCQDGRLGLERISRCGARLHPIAHLDNLSNRRVLVQLSATLTDRFAQGTGHSADRKSTRLNSSHVAISYAVFCLKKNT